MMGGLAAQRCRLLAATLLTAAAPAAASPTMVPSVAAADPPPAPPETLWPRAPTPAWDVGLVAGVCGVGQTAVWQGTEFCGAILGDVLWLRERRGDLGLGVFAAASTAGFYDFRPSAGVSLHVPAGQVLSFAMRAGPLVHVMGDAVLPGFVLQAELGVRAHNHSGHYSLTHALVLGWDQSFGIGSRAGSALVIALRLDAFWLAAPIGMLL